MPVNLFFFFFSSVPKVETRDQVDGAVNCHGEASIRVPYQRIDSLKNINILQQFLAIAYKKILFMKNEWFLALLLVSKIKIKYNLTGASFIYNSIKQYLM